MIHRTPGTQFSETEAPWPKIKSADFQVRLKPHQIATLEWVHLDTSLHAEHAITGGRSSSLGGLTEWTSRHQGKCLTMGWDWILCDDGQLMVSTEVAPRANIQVLDPAGYDRDHGSSAQGLWEIVTLIPWQREVGEWIGEQRVGNRRIG